MEQIIIAMIASVVTGGVAAFGTVKALHVHITYLKENLEKQDKSITRAHERIDLLER